MNASIIRFVCGLGLLLVLVQGCWRIGEPTTSEAVVTWAAFPDTVVAGETFPLEFAGPITPNACGRLDTATVAVTDTSLELSARRVTYETMCADNPIGFYEVRALELPPGEFAVRAGELELGRIVSREDGGFAPMLAVGTGTLERAGGCLIFGPGQFGNQRPFALRGTAATDGSLDAAVGSRRLVHVRGTLSGFTLCGSFGSRPSIRVSEARILDRTAHD
ncbi:MAG: hypothetical protein ACODAA_04950, partial [Gemmatimonadota bacterium]